MDGSQVLIFDIILAIVWLYFFLRLKETRQEMLVIGLVALLFSPLFVFLGRQTTAGIVDLTDFAFSFFFAGIAAVVFESVFGKHYRIGHHARLPLKRPGEQWFLQLMLATILWAWLSILLLFVLKTDALQSIIAAGLVMASYLLASRKDLLWNAIWSALLMAVVFFLVYALSFFYALPTASQSFLITVPFDALIWAMTLGFVLGPMYEYARGLKLRR